MKNKTFEENMKELEEIVDQLESGNVPLEDAMEKFKKGMMISSEIEKTLKNAETTLTEVMGDDDTVQKLDDNQLDVE